VLVKRLRLSRRSPVRSVGLRVLRRLVFVGGLVAVHMLVAPAVGWAVADIPTVIKNLRNWIVGLLSALATLFLTFGGVRYLLAGGDPGEVESAKRALKASSIGFGLAMLAPVLVTVLENIVGAGGGE
jgi:hypothetical protein